MFEGAQRVIVATVHTVQVFTELPHKVKYGTMKSRGRNLR